MRILFDTNILLDAVLAREPFVADAAFLLAAVDSGQIEGFLSATTVTDVHYVVKRQTKSAETAMIAVRQLIRVMEVCVVDRRVLEQAIALEFDDFEDSIQITCAILVGLDAIVTRDVKGFANSPVMALSPKELRKRLVSKD